MSGTLSESNKAHPDFLMLFNSRGVPEPKHHTFLNALKRYRAFVPEITEGKFILKPRLAAQLEDDKKTLSFYLERYTNLGSTEILRAFESTFRFTQIRNTSLPALSDDEIMRYIGPDSGGNYHLSPYYINLILLIALEKPRINWTSAFCNVLDHLITLVESKFKGSELETLLSADHYPEMLTMLIQLKRYAGEYFTEQHEDILKQYKLTDIKSTRVLALAPFLHTLSERWQETPPDEIISLIHDMSILDEPPELPLKNDQSLLLDTYHALYHDRFRTPSTACIMMVTMPLNTPKQIALLNHAIERLGIQTLTRAITKLNSRYSLGVVTRLRQAFYTNIWNSEAPSLHDATKAHIVEVIKPGNQLSTIDRLFSLNNCTAPRLFGEIVSHPNMLSCVHSEDDFMLLLDYISKAKDLINQEDILAAIFSDMRLCHFTPTSPSRLLKKLQDMKCAPEYIGLVISQDYVLEQHASFSEWHNIISHLKTIPACHTKLSSLLTNSRFTNTIKYTSHIQTLQETLSDMPDMLTLITLPPKFSHVLLQFSEATNETSKKSTCSIM